MGEFTSCVWHDHRFGQAQRIALIVLFWMGGCWKLSESGGAESLFDRKLRL
jgi:hypothetical protein